MGETDIINQAPAVEDIYQQYRKRYLKKALLTPETKHIMRPKERKERAKRNRRKQREESEERTQRN